MSGDRELLTVVVRRAADWHGQPGTGLFVDNRLCAFYPDYDRQSPGLLRNKIGHLRHDGHTVVEESE